MWNNNVKITVLFLTLALIGLLPLVSSAQGEYVKAKIYNLHPKPIVKASINGKTAYLLLDTGSDINILHSREAKKYNFAIHKINVGTRGRLATVNGIEREFGHAYDLHVMLSGRDISSEFIAMEIGNIVKSVRNNTGITIAGIIGSRTMKHHYFIIDYEKEEIAMGIKY